MWLEDMVLRKGEKKLQSYRLEAEGLKSSPSYLNYVPRIQSALSTARYWHGTGRYHYKDPTDVVDILTSIINDDGLKPHLDPWLDSGGKTVSLGTTRMHSRLFARVHLNERDTLVYELGSVRYWIRLYAVLLLFWLLTNLRSHREFIKKLFRRASIKEIQNRIHLLRKPRRLKAVDIRALVNGEALCSDIEGNYPILVAVAKDSLDVMETIPLTHAVEVRSLTSVHLKDFVHIEVPLAKVAETEELLIRKGIDLEVLPMEFVDIYMSDIPFRQLAYS